MIGIRSFVVVSTFSMFNIADYQKQSLIETN
jgi:hypothetical protein